MPTTPFNLGARLLAAVCAFMECIYMETSLPHEAS